MTTANERGVMVSPGAGPGVGKEPEPDEINIGQPTADRSGWNSPVNAPNVNYDGESMVEIEREQNKTGGSNV
jgi:hypothetical protein